MMFDFSYYYDRIAKELPDDCKLCEVGVANGDSALYMAKALHSMNKKFTLYMVDNMAYGGYDQMNELWRNIADSGLHKSIVVIPKGSIEASQHLNGNSLHFVFIDSSHDYWETKYSIQAWMRTLIDGYILAGHDYHSHAGVNQAVNELIPKEFLRAPIKTPEQTQFFKPHKLLNIEETENGNGIWWFKKDFYIKLNE